MLKMSTSNSLPASAEVGQCESRPDKPCQTSDSITVEDSSTEICSTNSNEGENSHAELSDDVIMTFIPTKFKSRAIALLKTLHQNIQWNSVGEIMDHNGFPVPSSHIVDLIRLCLHNYRNFDPIGADVFCQIMGKNNTPLGLINNLTVRNKIGRLRQTKDNLAIDCPTDRPSAPSKNNKDSDNKTDMKKNKWISL